MDYLKRNYYSSQLLSKNVNNSMTVKEIENNPAYKKRSKGL